jgi:peptidoglycan/xylan/chitin deacetylase (PgdA/CDA1 family)
MGERLPSGRSVRVLAAIPARQCEETIAAVVRGCRRHLRDVLVVDDGSSDATSARAAGAGALLVRHPCNLGKGAALRAAAQHCLRGGYTGLLTVDGDGQHDPADVPVFLEAHRSSPDTLWVGWRREALGGAPSARRFGNRFSNRALAILGDVHLPDTQCGMRLYPLHLLRRVTLGGGRYEAEAALLVKASALGCDMRPLPVSVRVADGRPTSHYRPWRDTARICAAVVGHSLLGRLPGWAETEFELRGAPGGREVALTFEGGPRPGSTAALLDLLERLRAPASFFMVGEGAERHPCIVREVASRGHAVGNHTYSLPGGFSLLGREALEREIDLTQRAVERATGRVPVVFRPPGGRRNIFLGRALARRGLRCVAWTLRLRHAGGDAAAGLAALPAQSLGLEPGSILALRDEGWERPGAREALGSLIESLRARGLTPVALPGAA